MRGSESLRPAGFTIIELALALFLLALLFGTVFVPLRAQVDVRNVESTERRLKAALEALLGFAATHGYFPCPSDEASAGREAPGADHGTGACSTYFGYLPAATLGLGGSDAQGYAVDAWVTPANRIRYAVSDERVGPAANTHTFTRVNGMRAAGIAALGDPALSLFHVCASARGVKPAMSCGSAPTIVSTAPVVVWSAGPNAATGGASADEAQNPNPNGGSRDRIFVSRVRSEAADAFDDIVAWLPMPRVVAGLLAAGQLP